MDRGLSTGTQNESEGLRERNVASQSASTLTPDALTATGDVEPKDKESKTYGRTPDGTGTVQLIRFFLIRTHSLAPDPTIDSIPCQLDGIAS